MGLRAVVVENDLINDQWTDDLLHKQETYRGSHLNKTKLFQKFIIIKVIFFIIKVSPNSNI